MEYNVENIRLLAEKYFRGETSLDEERTLREYFDRSGEVSADLAACRLLFGQSAEAAAMKPRRELELHRDPAAGVLRRRVAAASAIAAAAAVLAAVFVTVDFNRSHQAEAIVCYVNGELITDPQAAIEHAQEAIGIINAKLQEPAEIMPKTENAATIERVNDMLDALSAED